MRYRLSAAGQNWTLPSVQPPEQALERTRHLQPELLGLPLPCSVEETTFYEQQPQLLRRTEAQALALARLHSLQALYTAFPDAVLIARKEDTSCTDTTLEYTAVYTLEADICTQNELSCSARPPGPLYVFDQNQALVFCAASSAARWAACASYSAIRSFRSY